MERNKIILILNISMILLFLAFIYYIYPFFYTIISADVFLFPYLIVYSIFGVLVTYIFIIFYNFFIGIKYETRKINTWLSITFLLMVLVFVVGSTAIQYYFGSNELNLNLYKVGSREVVGNISCSGANGKAPLMCGEMITCTPLIMTKLSNVSAEVDFKMNNGSWSKQNFSELWFSAPCDSNYIIFYINGTDSNNNKMDIDVGWQFRFETENSLKEKKNNFIVLMIFLLGAVLFSVPSMMNNFKNLHADNKTNINVKTTIEMPKPKRKRSSKRKA